MRTITATEFPVINKDGRAVMVVVTCVFRSTFSSHGEPASQFPNSIAESYWARSWQTQISNAYTVAVRSSNGIQSVKPRTAVNWTHQDVESPSQRMFMLPSVTELWAESKPFSITVAFWIKAQVKRHTLDRTEPRINTFWACSTGLLSLFLRMSVSFGYQLMFFPSASCQLYDCGAGHWYCRLVLFLSNYQSQANSPISYVMIKIF